uniref:Putative elongation factor 1 alpha n=1 Tax=Amblyomma aureolatum TaxID=187763 RepID=A0A1E1X6B0_9ACAR
MSAQPLAAGGGDLSREDRERLVEQRMESMRLKNEELLRRHAEVEADKKNADLLSSAALKDNALRKPPQVATPSVSEKHESRPRVPRVRPSPPAAPRDSESRRMQRLSLEDGPPPDPNYRFLADRMREGDGDGGGESGGGGGDRGGSRRHRDNYGGQDFENVRHAMRQDKAQQRESGGHALPPKLAMTGRQRREYEQWKSDRASIDQERMQRHMDSEGHFTREWDLHKEHQLEPPSPPNETQSSSCQGGRIYLRGASSRGEGGRRAHHGPTRGRGRAAANGQNGAHRRGLRRDSQQRRHSTRSDASEGSSTSEDTQDSLKVLPPPPTTTDGGTTEEGSVPPAVEDGGSPTESTPKAKCDDTGEN